MTDSVPPGFDASLRSFAHEAHGSWFAAGDEPVDLAEEFHEASKMRSGFPAQMFGPAGQQLATSHNAHLALGRKALACTGPLVELPPIRELPVELVALARSRRSGLPDPCRPVAFDALSTVLAICAGPVPGRPDLRTTPSGGALYPLDVVVVAHAVTGLDRGAYVYDPIGHALLARGEFDPADFHAAAGESIAPHQPSVTLALVATFARSRAKYGLRGYRFSLIEAGHVAQAAVTAATALGLASLPWGGFIDAGADRMLELDGLERSCVYLVTISAERVTGGSS